MSEAKENVNEVRFEDAEPFDGSAAEFLTGDYLKPIQFMGQGTVNAVITGTSIRKNQKLFDGSVGDVGLVHLKGYAKPLKLGNSQIFDIAEIAESIKMKDWPGVEIGLKLAEVSIGGETKNMIKVTTPKRRKAA